MKWNLRLAPAAGMWSGWLSVCRNDVSLGGARTASPTEPTESFSSTQEAQCTMSSDIEVTIHNKNDVAIIDIKGDVTAVTGEAIEEAYQEASLVGSTKILLVFAK